MLEIRIFRSGRKFSRAGKRIKREAFQQNSLEILELERVSIFFCELFSLYFSPLSFCHQQHDGSSLEGAKKIPRKILQSLQDRDPSCSNISRANSPHRWPRQYMTVRCRFGRAVATANVPTSFAPLDVLRSFSIFPSQLRGI